MLSHTVTSFLRLLSPALLFAAGTLAHCQTAYFMSAGDFTENFDDIADTTAWPDGFLSSEPWASVEPGGTDPIPSPTRITTSTATLLGATSTSGGVQRGVENIYLLATGGNPGNTASAAIDLFLDFTNRLAGTVSFDAATVFNGTATSNREGELRLYYTTDGTNWSEITGGGLPYTATNNVAGSQAVSVPLPAALNEASSARFRFYYYNKSSVGTVSGSRPKISIDNLTVTSTSAGPDTTDPTLVSLSPADGDLAALIADPLVIRFSEPVVAGAGSVTLYDSSAPSIPIESFLASTANFQGGNAIFTPASPLGYATSYFIVVDSNAFTDAAGNPFVGIPSGSWTFTTENEPLPVPPLVVSLTPESNGSPVTAGPVALRIEFDTPVVAGSGVLAVFNLDDFAFENPIASFDITDPTDVTIEGNVVTFTEFPAVAGVFHNIVAPAGLLRSATDFVDSRGFGFGGDLDAWLFEVVAPDTAPPVIASTSPVNGSGASAFNILTATFDENVTLGAGPWTITVFDITANTALQTFTEADTETVSALGTNLTITLSGNLLFENEYRVTLSAGVVADSAGNLSGEVAGDAWRFTTGAPFAKGQVVISQVYGGGGNAGATLRNDFIELHNRSDAAISLSGWSVQYTSSGGSTWAVTPLTGTILPGAYYLIQQAAGKGGTEDLPTPDATGTSGMSGTSAKVALVNSITPLTGTNPLADPSISDFVGYGSANAFEGAGATPTLGNAIAAIRLVNGSKDTDNNNLDFVTGTPTPRNSSSPTFFPSTDGSGTAVATNASPGVGSLTGSAIFRSSGTEQAVKIDLAGTFDGGEITDIEILVPADFGVPSSGNVSLSGAGLGTGVAVANGQTVSISGAALTVANSLSVTISGLTAPDVSLIPSDDGARQFLVSTAGNGGTLTPVVSSPSVRVAMPVADLATLRLVSLPSPKAYILNTEAVVTYVTPGFRNQHWIQDATAGILIDDQPFVLGVAYAQGDGISNLVGTVSEFQGILQLNPLAAVSSLSSSGNNPTPLPVTLAQLAATPLDYQSRLVKVEGLTFDITPANFANESIHAMTQGTDAFNFRSFTGVDYVTTPLPSTAFDLVGIVRRVGATPADFISARSLADFITTPVTQPAYSDWAALYAGGGGANDDFNGDGVPNGVAYLFGAKTNGFVPTPGIVDGKITFPRDSSLADVSFVVQTSGNLTGWDNVPVEDLDLSDPDFITYVLPNAPAQFFLRIAVTVTPPAG